MGVFFVDMTGSMDADCKYPERRFLSAILSYYIVFLLVMHMFLTYQ